jgi:mycothiol synthase
MDHPMPTGEENTKRMSEFVAELVEEDPRQVLAAEEDGDLVGFLIFQRRSKTPLEVSHQWANISDLYVKPTHRGRGIARNLLQTCLDDLRSSGTTHVRVRVWSKNENAIRLYRQVGYGDHVLVLEAQRTAEPPQ